jgi:uncharacterized protein YndB with AHSA1/START domain
MLKKVLMGVAAFVVLFVLLVVTRPGTVHIERSRVIAAPPHVVFSILNDLHKFDSWSPWAKLDPNMAKDFSGAESGVGASYHWAGNDDVGEGRMTITAAEPGARVEEKLEFIKPFADTNTATYALAPEGEGTKVTWSLHGDASFMEKAMAMFMDMDGMVGKDFEEGLGNLDGVAQAEAARIRAEQEKAAAEAAAAAAAADGAVDPATGQPIAADPAAAPAGR